MSFEKFAHKKAKKPSMSENEKSAKMNVLEDLRKHAQSMMSDKMKGSKKVVVEADSKQGLGLGLEKAKELIEKENGQESSDEIESGDEQDSPEEESAESSEEQSAEEIDAKIAELMKKKEELKKEDHKKYNF